MDVKCSTSDDLKERIRELERLLHKFHTENQVLREVVAEEITYRMRLEETNERLASENKTRAAALYAIETELTAVSRKDELVKIIRNIMSKMTF